MSEEELCRPVEVDGEVILMRGAKVVTPKFPRTYTAEIRRERMRQDEKWGEQNHPNLTSLVMTVPDITPAEVAQHMEIPTADRANYFCGLEHRIGAGSWGSIALEEFCEAIEAAALRDDQALRTELVQLAAVCVAWIECIDRRADR